MQYCTCNQNTLLLLSLQIVDLSLLVKQEMTAKSNPISHVISASYIHYNTHTEVHTHPCLHRQPIQRKVISICLFLHQVKKDPDSPEATPPSTPGSSHGSKHPLQGNGSLDGRTRQRKRKKVCVHRLNLHRHDESFLSC